MKKTITMLMVIGTICFTQGYASAGNDYLFPIERNNLNDEISQLCKAAMKGDVEQVRSLLATGANVNEKSLGMTPAMYAARYNRAEVLKVLILNKANLNMKSEQGYTVKEYAEMSGATDVLNVLEASF